MGRAADGNDDATEIAHGTKLVHDLLHCRVLELDIQRGKHQSDSVVIGNGDELRFDHVIVVAVQAVQRRDDARLKEIGH
jgi:hypothetical protein